MANQKVKYAAFGAVVLLALVVIIGLVVHRSLNRRICDSWEEVYYIEDPITQEGKCLPVKKQGPCPEKMVLVPDRNNASIGVCECNVYESERAMIYDEKTNQCYLIFSQGYCEKGEWLNFEKNSGSFCEKRNCTESTTSTEEMVPKANGSCVTLGKNDGTCNNSDVIRFFRGKKYPACFGLGVGSATIGVPSHNCPKGYYSTGAGHCQPSFEFD